MKTASLGRHSPISETIKDVSSPLFDRDATTPQVGGDYSRG